MDNNKLAEILNNLKKAPWDIQRSEVKQYSVEMLELMAVNIYEKYSPKYNSSNKDIEILDIMLRERVRKLDRIFEWTEENKKTLLKVNDRITQVFEKAYNEAINISKELENKITQNDDFIQDYEIDIKIRTYIYDEYYTGEYRIGDVLSVPVETYYYPISDSFGHFSFQTYMSEKPIYLDKTTNWNFEYFGDTFENDYIGYAIHALLDTHIWSFNDIINIKKLWADVEIIHQHFEDI